MLKKLIILLLKTVLSLRYQIKTKNLGEISQQGKAGILFMPNHPALIDPAIINTVLFKTFHPRTLSDQKQLNLPAVKRLIELFQPISLPDLKESRTNREAVVAQLQTVVELLKGGTNVLLYPSGQIYRSRYEDLRSNSSVEFILKNHPSVRIVLVRTTGLWGSCFSWAFGDFPGLFKDFKKHLFYLFANFVFFMPRRKVEIDFYEPFDFPRSADRKTLNRFVENYYNQNAPPNTAVPYFWFSGETTRIKPEPQLKNCALTLTGIPAEISGQVLAKLSEITGNKLIKPTDSLSADLGIDSLALVDIVMWLESEFGFSQEGLEHLQTVGDLLLAACGEVSASPKIVFKPVPTTWFNDRKVAKLSPYEGQTITEAFLNQALSAPDQVVIADQIAGAKTNRDILTAVFVLKSVLQKYQPEKIGLMLPASVTASITYLALLFSGKTTVMVNWTVGAASLKYSLKLVECQKVLTSKKLLEKLQKQGVDYTNCGIEWIYLEDISKNLTKLQKIKGAISARFRAASLGSVKITKTAAILFTSGSEAMPKAVPLTHQNLMANARDYLSTLTLDNNSRMLGMLPPFHSFGLACGVILPLITGAKMVYHANPTEGAILGELIDRYRVSVLFGTPTFINGILQTTAAAKLASVRYLVTGAEKCPQAVYQKITASCPQIRMSEAYGITECSPVVSINDLNSPVRGSIGKVLPGMQYKILHPEELTEMPPGERGLLVLRGDNIFAGYLNFAGNSPFINFEQQLWYNTGDLVREDDERILWFCGRLKRFVKIGGEMISLSLIEEVLALTFPPTDNGPQIAVEAKSPDENPQLVLFCTFELEKDAANRLLRSAELSGLYNIRQIIRIENIPLLGTGKTDYRQLKEIVANHEYMQP